MKKLLKFTFLFILIMGWIYGFCAYTDYCNEAQQAVLVLLVFAPFTEELMFRETFYQFGKRFKAMAFAQILSAVVFGWVHQGNYFSYGPQYAMAVQGMFGIILFQVRKETNLFWCMVMHSAWNATLLYIF